MERATGAGSDVTAGVSTGKTDLLSAAQLEINAPAISMERLLPGESIAIPPLAQFGYMVRREAGPP
jgi:hypothetical protein